jgi:16S rRNA (guanine527-N7)-methyltransferase
MGRREEFLELLGSGEYGERLYQHYELLCKWNEKMNLTTVVSMGEAVQKHYRESLFLAERLGKGPFRLVDVGSGAGFPGIPVAAARPDGEVTLVESNQKKATFLKEATRGMGNVRVWVGRAEELKEEFDWVSLRAVRWEKRFARLGKSFALLVSDRDLEEIQGTKGMAWEEPVRLPGSEHGILLLGTHVPRET